MKYREFSDLGWKVSEIGLGCWQIGWCWGEIIQEKDARNILKQALDNGVNFFDTSDTYGDGRSERFLSEILKSSNDIYVTTKLGRRVRGTNFQKGYKHDPMEEFIDRSLKNLGVEKIDLVQLHCPPVEICKNAETFEKMDLLVKKGKVGHYGVSVYNLSEAYEAIKFKNVKSIQLVFNIFRQKPLDDLFKLAKQNKVAIIARGSLASGLLGGEFNSDTKFAENDHRNYNIKGEAFDIGDTFSGIDFIKGVSLVEEIKKILPKNFSMSQFALKWILMHDEVTVVIPGAINSQQVKTNCSVSDLEAIDEKMLEIKKLYDQYIKEDVHEKWN
jgi:aryl-alcohol dehydrogenase-like predicted oxidoreductase|tara:strand:+ start:488 stop:1474 length:987 start_codon:yes stop_codon:yes gene_type:complete